MEVLTIIYILVFIIFALIAFSVMQIKQAGMKVRDFAEFIQDKVPSMLWEDEYQKYTKILDIYRDIKIVRWNER